MAGYTRQSSADIIATAVVRANPINVEYNALRDAFSASTGHKHDGTAAEGAYVPLIADSDALNKVAIDTSNNRVGVFVEVSSAAVEQIRIQDGAIVPVTTNDIDLGTSSLQFKDLHLAGTATMGVLQMSNATLTGNLTVNGNTTLGNAASDTVTVTADVASPLLPSADDTFDLGAVGSEWRNLYIDGTANIDALVADTADINGGSIDGVTIGGASAAAGTFTSLNASGTSTLATVDINGGAIDGTIIGANSAAAITGTTITGTSLVGAVTGDVTGNADTATALETARTIGGVSFDGTANINLPGVNTAGSQATSGNAATATALETARTIGGVSFNGTANINLPGVNAAGNQDTSGNAASATVLETARTIAGNSFNGSANITIAATDLSDTNQSLATGDNVQFAQVTTTGNAIIGGDLTVNGTTTTTHANNLNVADQLIELAHGRTGSPSGDSGIVIERGSEDNAFIGFDESADKFKVGTGTFTGASTGNLNITTGTLIANIEGNVTGAVTGNASTATALATARTIAGQSFDGTANINIAPTDLTSVTATAAELNIVDGDTSASTVTLVDADKLIINDNGTMKQVAITNITTYLGGSLGILSNVTAVGALDSGSITSGFGAIDNGSSTITTTGTVTFGTLSDGTNNITDIVTSVSGSSTNAQLPSAAAVESRIQAVSGTSNNVTGLTATGPEINAVADVSAITIDTSTAIANNDGIAVFDSSASSIGYFDVDLLDTYFSGTTKTLTNKTLTSPVVTGMHLNDSGFTVEGSAADGNETTVTFTNPTADHTITFPNATGTVALSNSSSATFGGNGSTGGVTLQDGLVSIRTGTGNVAAMRFYCEVSNAHYVELKAPPHSAFSGNLSFALPAADGSSGQFLKTDGSGVLSFADAGGGFDADFVIADKTSAYTVVAGDAGKVISHSANNITITLTAASTLGAGFHVWIKNDAAAGDITTIYFANAGNDALDGRTGSTKLFRGESIHIYTDGSNFYSLDRTIMWTGNNDTTGFIGPAASGAGSIAAGHQASATGADATAIGYSATATSQGSFAIGESTTASSSYALALGYQNTASGFKSIAMGDASTASHTNSVSIGDSVQSTAANQINLGSTADTVRISETYTLPTSDGSANQVLTTNGSGVVSFATAAGGADLYAANESSPAAQPNASGTNAIAIGDQAVSSGTDSFAIGTDTDATGSNSLAIGKGAQATANHNLAIGLNASASAERAIAIGNNGVVAGSTYSTAIGHNSGTTGSTTASGSGATALGGSRAAGADSLAAAVANNTSSYGATGANSVAIGNLAKAVGTNSLAIGARAETTGTSAIAIGHSYGNYGCVAASGGIAIGDGNNADAIFSTALGYRAKAATKGKFAFAVGQFAAQGDAQGGMYILRADTTDATATVLTTNNATAAADNQIVAASDTCITFDGTIVAMQNGAQAFASFRIEGLLVNDGGTTTLANSATTVIDNQSSWTLALSADNTNNALAITVTGEASHNIRWVANIRTSEVTYA